MNPKELESAIVQYAVVALAKRFERLKTRQFVLFPVLRARFLLRRLRKVIGV